MTKELNHIQVSYDQGMVSGGCEGPRRNGRGSVWLFQAGVKGLDAMAEVAFGEDSRFNLSRFVLSGASKVSYTISVVRPR